MHKNILQPGVDFEVEGEHSIRQVEFDHVAAKEGQITVVRGLEGDTSDWIITGLEIDDWVDLREMLKSGSASVADIERFLEANGYQLGESQ